MRPILGYILNSELNVPYCGQSLDPVLTGLSKKYIHISVFFLTKAYLINNFPNYIMYIFIILI